MAVEVGTEYSERARALAYRVTLASLVLMFALPPIVGMAVDYTSFAAFFLAAAIFAPALLYAKHRQMRTIRNILEALTLNFLLSGSTLVITYCAMALKFPLADSVLAGMDATFGINASEIVLWVDRHAMLTHLLALAYTSFAYQLLILPLVVSASGHGTRVHRFFSAFFTTATICTIVGAFFPALAAFNHFGLTDAGLSSINTKIGYEFAHSFVGVRDDPNFVLSLENASGVVTFPSVHAAVAVLCAWLVWPLAVLRLPIIILNIAMAFSAVTHGAHYLVDVVAGMLVAVASLGLVETWLKSSAVLAHIGITPARAAPAGEAVAR